MTLAIAGTPVGTDRTATATTAVINLPSSIAAGELLVVSFGTSDPARIPEHGDWTDASGTAGTARVGLVWKIASGSEGATETFTYSGPGTSQMTAVAARITGHDATTPFSDLANAEESSEDPFTLAADILTGLAADSFCWLVWVPGPSAVRSIVTLDADLTLVLSTDDDRQHVAMEEDPGSGNAAYSTDMSDTRAWRYALLELHAAAAAGGLTIPIAAYHYNHHIAA